jgi:hydroxysqualene synthase
VIHRAFGASRAAAQVPAPPEPLEEEACYRYCEALTRARHHNFPVASFFVPARLRPHIFAIYSFARCADDFVDEPEFAGRRASELDRWEEHLESVFHDETPSHPVFVALANTIAAYELPITPFAALMSGFRGELEVRRYATHADLRRYTRLAAEPVGQLYLYLSGYRDPTLHRYAEELSSGLAFANFWQDVGADLDRGRVYLPGEDLEHFGVSEAELLERRRSPALRALIRYEVSRTRAMFERARPLIDAVGDDIAVELALMWHGGNRILDKIAAAGDEVLGRRPRLTSVDKGQVVARALAWRGGSLLRRSGDRARGALGRKRAER